MTDPVINSSFARSPSGVGLVTVVIGSDDKSLTEIIARLEATQKQLETTQKQLDTAQKTIVVNSDDKRLTDTIARLEATQKQLETAIRRIEQLETKNVQKDIYKPGSADISANPKINEVKQLVTMTDAIFKQLKPGDHVKLKSTLTRAET